MKCALLQLGNLRLDFQPPENLIEETVLKWISKIRSGESLPSIRVRFDGTTYFLEDGFHRVEAAKRSGLCGLHAEIRRGTLEEMEAEFQEYLQQLKAALRR